jgi:hypothetical protein
MRTQPKLRMAAVLVVTAILGGCGDLTDLNVNPNEPVDVGAEFLLPTAVIDAVYQTHGAYLNMDMVGLWVQYYAEHQYTVEDVFEISDASISSRWSSFYADPLRNLWEVIQQGESQNRPNVIAAGTILEHWIIQVVTDLWGDAGYTEALLGRDSRPDMSVPYDTQEDIYDGILDHLAAAAAMIDPNGAAITSGDLLYGGDMNRWKLFANSLRLRAAMRLSEVDPARGKTEFASALSAGVLGSNEDNAVVKYFDDGVSVHPIYAYERSRNDHSISKTMVDTLRSLADPRLPIYAQPNQVGEYTGTPNGSMENPLASTVTKVGTYFSSPASTAVIMGYAEVLFLQAEAAHRGWIAGDPGALYREAITAAMSELGLAQSAIDVYLDGPAVAYEGGAVGLQQIQLQKWIALFGNGPEAYAEWRRTGVPNLVAGPDALNDGRIPIRLEYPERERTLNRVEVEKAITRQSGATLNTPVWWDVH